MKVVWEGGDHIECHPLSLVYSALSCHTLSDCKPTHSFEVKVSCKSTHTRVHSRILYATT